MTALATRTAIQAALSGEADVQAFLGHPARIHDQPVSDSLFPHAVWRASQSRNNGSSLSQGEVHDFTLEVRTLETGSDVAEKAVQALASAINRAKPSASDVHIVLLMTTLADVMRGPDGRTFRGLVRLRAVAEPIAQAA